MVLECALYHGAVPLRLETRPGLEGNGEALFRQVVTGSTVPVSERNQRSSPLIRISI
jgi:hypothetical protein